MNTATSRFTISTIAVAACAMVALVAAEPARAHESSASPVALSAPLQRIEIVGRRPAPAQRIEVVGRRAAEPGLQRIEIVGKRLRNERVAAAEAAAKPL